MQIPREGTLGWSEWYVGSVKPNAVIIDALILARPPSLHSYAFFVLFCYFSVRKKASSVSPRGPTALSVKPPSPTLTVSLTLHRSFQRVAWCGWLSFVLSCFWGRFGSKRARLVSFDVTMEHSSQSARTQIHGFHLFFVSARFWELVFHFLNPSPGLLARAG